MGNKLSANQKFVIDYLVTKQEYVSPTEVGRIYGTAFLNRDDCHSSTGSPILKKLVSMGYVERSTKGWYKIIKREQDGE